MENEEPLKLEEINGITPRYQCREYIRPAQEPYAF